jgi:hypothetical protein
MPRGRGGKSTFVTEMEAAIRIKAERGRGKIAEIQRRIILEMRRMLIAEMGRRTENFWF